ncbi:sigma-70 family RNA polymerase sigma factor [Parapedobacter defluvii]|uniref:RNA polymerase sigma factor n=1 Tax=Parapedobacter defluvii TaxID=2045106 RepID=UPI00333FBAA4
MDKAEFLKLINDHQAIVWKVCRLYGNSAEDHEDLFQEIAFQLWKSRFSFKGDARFTTWMYRIALNTAITSLRRKRPEVSYPGNVPDLSGDIPDEDIADKREKLFSAIRLLDDMEKAVITFYLEELTYAEIAEAMGISENLVGVKLNRIKDKIRKLIGN